MDQNNALDNALDALERGRRLGRHEGCCTRPDPMARQHRDSNGERLCEK